MRQIHQIPCSLLCMCNSHMATDTWLIGWGCSKCTLPSLAWAKFPWSISVCAHNSWGGEGEGKEVPPTQCCAEQCLLCATLCLGLHDRIKPIFSVSLLLSAQSYTHAQPSFWDTAGVAVLEKNLALWIHHLQLPFPYSNGHCSFPVCLVGLGLRHMPLRSEPHALYPDSQQDRIRWGWGAGRKLLTALLHNLLTPRNPPSLIWFLRPSFPRPDIVYISTGCRKSPCIAPMALKR